MEQGRTKQMHTSVVVACQAVFDVVSCHIFSERQPVYDQVDDCESGDEHVWAAELIQGFVILARVQDA